MKMLRKARTAMIPSMLILLFLRVVFFVTAFKRSRYVVYSYIDICFYKPGLFHEIFLDDVYHWENASIQAQLPRVFEWKANQKTGLSTEREVVKKNLMKQP